MVNIDELTIGEAKEIAGMFTNHGDDFRPAADGDLVIVVLQRGWIVVGNYSQTGNTGKLDDANVVRIWGTKNGLGELAKNGPLENTKLDPCPPIKFHVREMVMVMEVNKNAWRK